jgi:sorbitol/mannitol transport system substrate-binding protein
VAGGDDGGQDSINVLMVGNPQMVDIEKLTADHFTKETGIKVNYTILPENELRDKVTQDIATQAGLYDVATIGAYEVPIWSKNGWLNELDSYADADEDFDKDDLLDPIVESLSGDDGSMYALPARHDQEPLAFLEDTDLFGDLRHVRRFTAVYQRALESLRSRGARATLESWEAR